jgi:glycosyltransferase involved in cell wall biosynthesis
MSRFMASTTHDIAVESSSKPEEELRPKQALHVVCLSPQLWRVDLPTNRQQVMTRVARSGHRVLYVETGDFIGRHVVQRLRRPDRRALLRQLVSGEPVARGIHAIKAPTIAPWGHRFRFATWLNARLTARMVRRKLRENGDPAVLWLYDPCFAACIGRSGERFAVYDCVDDYAEQAGNDRRKRALLSAQDALAASRSRLVFATAAGLAERHLKNNRKTHLVRNVGDYAHFSRAADESIASEIRAERPGPVIGFAGNFLANKVDFELLEAIATRRPDWVLLLVGPARDDTRSAVHALAERENVRWLGPIAYDELPRYVAAFDVATIPYLRNAYTRNCFPLKTYEYLAAGKPVVASGLPELERMEPHVVVAADAEGFIAAIDDALSLRSESHISIRQELAAANTWETRTARLLELVGAEL